MPKRPPYPPGTHANILDRQLGRCAGCDEQFEKNEAIHLHHDFGEGIGWAEAKQMLIAGLGPLAQNEAVLDRLLQELHADLLGGPERQGENLKAMHEDCHAAEHRRLRKLQFIKREDLMKTEEQMLNDCMSQLMHIKRYRGGKHLDPANIDTTGQHTKAAMALAEEYCRDANLPSEDIAIIKDMILVHDFGEILGEFSSLDQVIKNGGPFDIKKEVEQNITRFALSWAIKLDAEAFAGMIRDMRDEIAQYADDPVSMSRQAVALINQTGLPELGPEQRQVVTHWMRIYDRVEQYQDFTAHAAKVIEKLQSQRHFMEYAGEGNCEVLDDVNNIYMRMTLEYAEKKLPGLFAAAQTEEQFALARMLRREVYLSCARFCAELPVSEAAKDLTRMYQQGAMSRTNRVPEKTIFAQCMDETQRGAA